MKLRIALLICSDCLNLFDGKRYPELFRDFFDEDQFILDEYYIRRDSPTDLPASQGEYRVACGYPTDLSEYSMVALTGSSKDEGETVRDAK